LSTEAPSSFTNHESGDTESQRKALDAIGDALKHRRIDFYIATKLRDLVKSGRVDEALEALSRFERQN